MALTLRTNGSSGVNLVTSSWWNDYYNLFTGAMHDQPVFLYYEPSSGTNPPALKLQTNANANLLEGLNSGGGVVFTLDYNGNVYGAALYDNNNRVAVEGSHSTAGQPLLSVGNGAPSSLASNEVYFQLS